jgi:hypothetical protein
VAGTKAFDWELALDFLTYLAEKDIINRATFLDFHIGICSMPAGNKEEKETIGKLTDEYHKEYIAWRTKRRLLGEESR